MNQPLFMRPHHGLCLQHFVGKGYNSKFVQRMTVVSAEMKVNPTREIVLFCKTDLLCEACPHNSDGICEDAQKVARYDEKCLALCGLHNGQTLSWQEFQRIMIQKILQPGRLQDVCTDCCWSGICQSKKIT